MDYLLISPNRADCDRVTVHAHAHEGQTYNWKCVRYWSARSQSQAFTQLAKISASLCIMESGIITTDDFR